MLSMRSFKQDFRTAVESLPENQRQHEWVQACITSIDVEFQSLSLAVNMLEKSLKDCLSFWDRCFWIGCRKKFNIYNAIMALVSAYREENRILTIKERCETQLRRQAAEHQATVDDLRKKLAKSDSTIKKQEKIITDHKHTMARLSGLAGEQTPEPTDPSERPRRRG